MELITTRHRQVLKRAGSDRVNFRGSIHFAITSGRGTELRRWHNYGGCDCLRRYLLGLPVTERTDFERVQSAVRRTARAHPGARFNRDWRLRKKSRHAVMLPPPKPRSTLPIFTPKIASAIAALARFS